MGDLAAIVTGPLTDREKRVHDHLPQHAWDTPQAIAKRAGLAKIDGELASLMRRGLARRYGGMWRAVE